jgi:carbamate kinase
MFLGVADDQAIGLATLHTSVAYQVLGLLVIAVGLLELRKQFGKPGLRNIIKVRISELTRSLRRKQGFHGQGSTATLGPVVGYAGTLERGSQHDPQDEVTALREAVTQLQNDIGVLKKQLATEEAAREESHQALADRHRSISDALERAFIGGITLEFMGLTWLLAGIVFPALPRVFRADWITLFGTLSA